MADGIYNILDSAGPMAPLDIGAGVAAQQAADPRVLASSSGPVGQAIGQLTATFGAMPQAMDYARQIGEAQSGAMTDMGKYLSASDPVATAAADTGGNPVARWAMLRTTPLQLAQMRNFQAETQLRSLQAGFRGGLGGAVSAAYSGFPQLAGTTTATVPARGAIGTGTAGAGTAGGAFADQNVDLGSGQANPPDPLANMPQDPTAMRSYVNGLPPWQRNLLRQRIARTGWAPAAPPAAR